ncbi:MAG TPA: ectonucleotide pyrophosphatase/phosphodiesterase [Clostridia bacterium]|nr:ectonucleotide pyrophosphatase/phosphodiesterase [Clostridia bacterium]
MTRTIQRSLLVLLIFAFCIGAVAQEQGRRVTTILVSIDGLRYDYMDRYDMPNLRALAAEGVRAEAMQPSFPSKTFPNHYTIVTGLYPAHHGIIANNMWDPQLKAKFSLHDRAQVQNPRWWGGEPIWVTAERQNCPAATLFWPGSEVAISGVRPTHWLPYDHTMSNSARVDRLIEWVSLEGAQQPCIATLYFEQVDNAGHDFGPDAPQTAAAAHEIDGEVGRLIQALRGRNLWDKVNLIVVSDHGMARTPASQRIPLDDYIDLNSVEIADWNPVLAISPKKGSARRLAATLNAIPHVRAYVARDAPKRWHYSGNRRITPVIAVADEGWSIVTRKQLAEGLRHSGGNHGFDNDLDSMRATFVARGPAFKPGSMLPVFSNVNVYSLLTRIIGLRPAANDGTVDVFLPVLRNQ